MILEHGNMWDVFGKTDLFLITTNPIINKQGNLVMGRGIAKEFAERFPTGPKEFASIIRGFPNSNVGNLYYEPVFGKQHVGYFMVKDHWAENAKISIIMRSVADLYDMAASWGRIDLNFPGIGNGKLKMEDVLPIVQQLPDNVHVWTYGPQSQ